MLKWISPWRLSNKGILGMNGRNIDFIGRYNPRHLYPLVDNKLQTKLLAKEAGIAMPALHGVVEQQHQVAQLMDLISDQAGFAIKPARGSGGKGILIITDRESHDFIRGSGKKVSFEDLQRHVTNILAGLYSLAGKPDVAIIEELVSIDPMFNDYSFQGVPDIRIIVFKGYPVMAMLRLSTRQSDGKANLHQGAIGVGLNMATGKAVYAVQHEQRFTHHPDTEQPLNKIVIPDWSDLLELAAGCYEITGLGYLGVDIVLDHKKGPMLLELNARPGLSIQLANGCGLLPRLRTIEALASNLHANSKQRVEFVQNSFN